MTPPITLPRLRTLLGSRARHRGELCKIVEVLDTPLSLVLQSSGRPRLVADVHGRPYEYGSQTYTLPVLNDERSGLNDDFLNLEILD